MAKILNPDKKLHRLIGWWRQLHNQCPRCNSDGPAVDNCFVCKQEHVPEQVAARRCTHLTQHYPPTRATKALRWYTWMHPSFKKMQQEWDEADNPYKTRWKWG